MGKQELQSEEIVEILNDTQELSNKGKTETRIFNRTRSCKKDTMDSKVREVNALRHKGLNKEHAPEKNRIACKQSALK